MLFLAEVVFVVDHETRRTFTQNRADVRAGARERAL